MKTPRMESGRTYAVKLCGTRASCPGAGLQYGCLSGSRSSFFLATKQRQNSRLGQDLASDIVETMRSKVARRKHKLLSAFQGQVDENVVSFADKVMIDAARELVDCQCHLIANESPDNNLRRLESINCVSDTVHRLKKLDDFINSISDRTLSQRRAFFYPPTCMSVLSKGVLPALSQWSTYDNHDYTAFRLAGVEAWVAHHLDGWLSDAMMSEKACSELSDLMTTYERIATSIYSKNPEGRSNMVLVLIETLDCVRQNSNSPDPTAGAV